MHTVEKDGMKFISYDGGYMLTEYAGTAAELEIPGTIRGAAVKSIDNSAFIECTALVSVTIPDKVEIIYAYAFYGCTSLESVTIGKTMNIFQKYRSIPYERKIIAYTIIGICFSSLLACGKLIIGIFTDYNLCGVAVYTFAFILAKLECVLGVKTNRRTLKKRNLYISLFLLLSSLVYIAYNVRLFFIEREAKKYGMGYVLIIAFISFVELGFAIAGLFRTKSKGHYYRTIKIINFGIALTAILTTQITLLDYMSTGADEINTFTGIAVGAFIALCSVYISAAPKLSVAGRERNVFVLKDGAINNLVNMESRTFEIVLCKSFVYGDYVYRAKIQSGTADGYIVRAPSLFKRMPLFCKVVCCILSEILIFVWLLGRAVLFIRSAMLPEKLEKIMNANGFERSRSSF